MKIIIGVKFISLFKMDKKATQLSKTKDVVSSEWSSSKLKGMITNEWHRRFRPNPISIGLLCVLFVVLYVCGCGMIFDYCNFPTKVNALVSLSFISAIAIIIPAIPYSLGRGHTFGLQIILLVYFLDILLTLTGFVLMVMKSVETALVIKQLILFPLQILLIYLCYSIMNSESFSRVVLFYQTQRLVQTANKKRQR